MFPAAHRRSHRPSIGELTDDSPKAPQPEGCGVELKPHQLATLHRCLAMEGGTVPLADFPVLSDMMEAHHQLHNPLHRHSHVSAATRRFQQQQEPPVPEPTPELTPEPTPEPAESEADEDSQNFLRTRVGIIGDKAGAGKSYVILGIVRAGKGFAGRNDPVTSTFGKDRVLVSCRLRPPQHQLGLTVLVIPHNLCTQWDTYVDRFGAGLAVRSISRTKHITAYLGSEGDALLATLDLLIVTSTFHNAFVRALGRRAVRRVVYDEVDSMAIPCCQAIETSFTWFVTASYGNLLHPNGGNGDGWYYGGGRGPSGPPGYAQGPSDAFGPRVRAREAHTGIRSTGSVKALFVDLGESVMSTVVAHALVVRSADAFVDASIVLPAPVVRIVPCHTPLSVRVLSGVRGVDGAILQCLNAGDVQTALSHVSPLNRGTEENIVALLMEKLGRQVHNLELSINQVPTMQYEHEAEREAELARRTKQRDELAGRMERIRERVRDSDTCCICYDAIKNKTVAPCCSNAYCFACVSRWINRSATCPLCKSALTPSHLMVVDAAAEAAGPSQRKKDKIEMLEEILRNRFGSSGDASGGSSGDASGSSGSSKVLLFSSFDNTFNEITAVLDRMPLRYRFLKGNNCTVARIVREYREGGLDVLLVNTNNYGNGLNFENTTDVIMLHKFDTEIEHQVLGRAQRCGRTEPLNVWYLLHENEL